MELAASEVARVAGEMSLAIVRRAVTRRHLKAWVTTLRKAADEIEKMLAASV